MKVTWQVKGQKMTFTEEQVIAILEEYFSIKGTLEVPKVTVVLERPSENKWFKVNPASIDQQLFEEARVDKKQEETRQIIKEAFCEVNNSSKYSREFYTMIPEKKWTLRSVEELRDMGKKMGDHMTDWVEQALEWAQRISNGESWEDVCNNPDTANWYRLIVWKDGNTRFVGGSRKIYDANPASEIDFDTNISYLKLNFCVPSIVRYK